MSTNEYHFEKEIVSLCNTSGVSLERGAQMLLDRAKANREFSLEKFLEVSHPYVRRDIKLALFRFFNEPVVKHDDKEFADRLQKIGRYSRVEKLSMSSVDFIVHAGHKAGSTTLCQLAAAFEVVSFLKSTRENCLIVYWTPLPRDSSYVDYTGVSRHVKEHLPKVVVEASNTLADPIVKFTHDGRMCSVQFYRSSRVNNVCSKSSTMLISDDIEWAFTQERIKTPALLTFSSKTGPGLTKYAKAYAAGMGMSIEIPDFYEKPYPDECRAIRL